MVRIDDFKEEKSCVYKGEEYLVRDNGAVLRKTRPGQRVRKCDNEWTFGKVNTKGYFCISSALVHRIIAVAFLGEPPTDQHIVDHIDTNRSNNRSDNLRWITKLENLVINEFTRKKIEHLTGVSIFDFLDDPEKYKEILKNSDFSWMRRVTEEEAKACLANLQRLNAEFERPPRENRTGYGEWLYHNEKGGGRAYIEGTRLRYRERAQSDVINSLTPMAKQKEWRTPTEFYCCPDKIDGDAIECYLRNLSENIRFSGNQYGETYVTKYASVDNKFILVITEHDDIKPFGLTEITFENGYYLHTSMGMFFEENGVEKQFTIKQGLEWTGGDSIDDYC